MVRKARKGDICEGEAMKLGRRPADEAELNSILRNAYSLAMKGQYAEALDICNWLIENPTTEIAGLRKRSAVLEHKRDVAGAITDLQTVIRLCPDEPADYYSLGILLLSSGETLSAVSAFTSALKIGETRDFTYYKDPSLLFRAEAQLKLTQYKKALDDVQSLPDGFGTYIPGTGMRTKENIAKEAKDGIECEERNRFKMR
jgi:tetratricopeptide (TPR) repeat protein